jgi:hypothetical protein
MILMIVPEECRRRARAADRFGEHVKAPLGGFVRGRVEDMTGGAVKDLKGRSWASAERVLPDHPNHRGPRVTRKDHHVGMPAVRQNASSNRLATFS